MVVNNIIVPITLLLAGVWDFKYFKIPNWITYPLIITGILWTIFNPISITEVLLKTGFCIALIFIPLFGQGGDRKILIGLTLMLGALNAVLIFILAATLAGIGILLRNKYYLKTWLPYGLLYEKDFETNIGTFFLIAYAGLLTQGVIA